MSERPVYFDRPAREEIRRAVRIVRGGSLGRPTGTIEDPPQSRGPEIWLARAKSTITAGTVGTFTLRRPNGNKGSEADGSDDVDAYVRQGLCLIGKDYLLIEVCGGNDALFEVLNPWMTVRGKTAGDIAAGGSGTLNIYTGTFGSETQPSGTPSISNVRNDSSCTVKGSQIATAEFVPDNNSWQFRTGKTS